MGRLLIPSGGAGGSSGDCTATKSDVLKGVTAITSDSNDERAFGTLELTGNITAADIRKGKTGYSTDPKNKISGQMKEISGKTVTPSTTQVVAVEANTFVTGNIFIPSFKLPAANIIKKNEVYELYGKSVRGTFSGFVPDETDLYIRGNNVAGWSNWYSGNDNVSFDTGQISIEGDSWRIYTAKRINMAGSSKLNIEFQAATGNNCTVTLFGSNTAHDTSPTTLAQVKPYISGGQHSTIVIDITAAQVNKYLDIYATGDNTYDGLAIFRIWLS